MNRSRKSLKNLMSSVGLNLITILASFLATPFILHMLGDVRFGLYRTIFEWIGFSSILSVSYLSFSSQMLARQKNELIALESEITAHFSFGIQILLILLPLAAGFIFISPYILGSPQELIAEIRWSSLLGCTGLIFIPFLVIQGFLEAQNRSYLVNTAMTVQRISVIAFSVLGAMMFKNIESQFVALLLGQLLFFIIIYRPAKLKLGFSKFSSSFWKKLIPFVKIDLAGKLGISADTIIISLLMGPHDVTKFYLLIRLPTLLMGQLMSLGNSVWAGFSQVYKSGGDAKILFLRLTKAVAILAGACGGSIFLFNSDFLALWLSQSYEFNFGFNALVAFNLYGISLISFFGWMLTAAQGEQEFAKASLLSAFANIAIGVGATLSFGLIGPVIGSAVGYGLIKMIWILRAVRQKIHVVWRNLSEVILLPLVLGIVYFYGIFYLRTSFNFYALSWIQLIVIGLSTNCIYLFLCWFVLLRKEERKYWILRISKTPKEAS